MAAPQLDVDWPGIRAAAIAIGNVSEAARRAAVDLPEEDRERFREAVSKRAVREQWLSKADATRQGPSTLSSVIVQNAMSKNVQSGADLLSQVVAENGRKSRLHQSGYLVRASDQLEQLPDEQLLAHAKTAKALAGTHAKLYPETAVSGMILNVFAISADQHPVIDV